MYPEKMYHTYTLPAASKLQHRHSHCGLPRHHCHEDVFLAVPQMTVLWLMWLGMGATRHGQRKRQSLHESRDVPGSARTGVLGAGHAGSCHPMFQWVTEAGDRAGTPAQAGPQEGAHSDKWPPSKQVRPKLLKKGIVPASLYHTKKTPSCPRCEKLTASLNHRKP